MTIRIDYEKVAPAGVKALFGVHAYVAQSGLDPVLVELVYLRVSEINGCFFDTDDGERRCRDEVGIDLAERHDVPEEAAGLLRDLVHVRLPIGRRAIAVEVREAGRATVYRATMTVVGRAVQ